jgi:hypothetical protein
LSFLKTILTRSILDHFFIGNFAVNGRRKHGDDKREITSLLRNACTVGHICPFKDLIECLAERAIDQAEPNPLRLLATADANRDKPTSRIDAGSGASVKVSTTSPFPPMNIGSPGAAGSDPPIPTPAR